MNLGLRYDRWSMGFKGGPGLDNLPVTNDLSPRLGVNVDLFGDGRTSLNAFYGRFYEEFHGTTIDNFDPQQSTFYCLEFIDGVWESWCRINPLLDVGFDPDLTNQYANQFVVGIDHQLTEDLAITARYIRKDNKNIFGGEDIRTVFAPVEVTDIDGEVHTLYNAVGGLDRFQLLTNNPNEDLVGESFREYNGVQFKAVKRMSDNWSLIGSVLIQKAEGNNFADTGSLTAADDPNDFVGRPGESGSSRRFVSKIQGSYDFVHPVYGAQFGWIVNWLSGGRTARTQRFTTFFDPATGQMGDFGQNNLTVPIDPIGSDTFPSEFKLDLRADKQFPLDGPWGTLGLVFDIFNVFNADTVVGYSSTRVDLATFYEPDTIIQPRIWRLGVRWEF
jgi:hypothetical protein